MSLAFGRVLKSTGSWYEVFDEKGQRHSCRLRGNIRLKGMKSTNPVAVGDYVRFDPVDKVIKEIEERDNYLVRRSNNLSRYSHIIASNIDQAVLVASYKEPRTSQGFIDRFLITCEAYGIVPFILMNKIDLLSEDELEEVAAFLYMYERAGYESMCISANRSPDDEIEKLKDRLRGKTSLVSGHSGVGKSSILNRIAPNLDLKIGEVSTVHYKGKHTTTFAEMFEIEENTFLIDSPGIKDFGLVHMEPEELAHYFPEFRELLPQCKFHNCRHLNEPKCAVKEAAEKGEIEPNRYWSYLTILESDEDLQQPDYLWRKTV